MVSSFGIRSLVLDVGGQTHDLIHAKQILYHSAESPAIGLLIQGYCVPKASIKFSV